ncbi:phage fiber-tail adaptor protein [Caballeronia telluris]|uniref:Uncharacterized protein n=1 Tax=Caballeronia telluris TaxID=326475 RepID=A0A158G092_9BURK|nr:hypothetical protein AWB66_01457 [Caballeronia telluris]
MQSFTKDPIAVLDFEWDWSAWLASGETIAEASAIATNGLTVNSSTVSGARVSAWISGGTSGQTCAVKCQVRTSAGRTDARSILISVEGR